MNVSSVSLALVLMAFSYSADNWLQNGDFSDGVSHWRGNGRTAADFASENPFDKPDPLLSKGMIMALRPGHWLKVEQDFRGKHDHAVLNVNYKVSPDFKLSEKPEDYQNLAVQLGYDGWRSVNSEQGSWIVFLNDFGSSHGTYYEIKPKLGTSEVQTYRVPVRAMTPLEEKTIALAFPPGTGKLIVLSVSLEDENTANP